MEPEIKSKRWCGCLGTIAVNCMVLTLFVIFVVIPILVVKETNDNATVNVQDEVVGKLAPDSPRHSIPKNTELVAAIGDVCHANEYIVKDKSNNYYKVELYSKKVIRIAAVDVVGESTTIVKQEVKEL